MPEVHRGTHAPYGGLCPDFMLFGIVVLVGVAVRRIIRIPVSRKRTCCR